MMYQIPYLPNNAVRWELNRTFDEVKYKSFHEFKKKKLNNRYKNKILLTHVIILGYKLNG